MMEDKDIPTTEVSDWQPITNKLDLAILGKLGEELSECATAIFRCIIQGIDEKQPVTGKVNKEWLEDEMADIIAMSEFVFQHFNLDRERMTDRARKKHSYKVPWFASLRKEENK